MSHLRHANGMTMSQLAKQVGVSESYISLLESGVRNHPSRELTLKLARALGADSHNNLVDDFLVTAGYYPADKKTYQTHTSTIAAYRQQILENPADFETYTTLIFALIKMGETDDAQGLIQKGLIQFEDTVQLQALLASLELAKNNFQKALNIQHFALEQQKQQQSSDSESETQRLRLNLGVIYFLKGYHHLETWMAALAKDKTGNSEKTHKEKQSAYEAFYQGQQIFAALLLEQPENIYLMDEYARVTFNLAHLAMGTAPENAALWTETITRLKAVIHAEHKFSLGHSALLEACAFLAHAYSKVGDFSEAETLMNFLEITIASPHWLILYLKACFYSLRAQSQKHGQGLELALNCLHRAKGIDPQAVLQSAWYDTDLDWLRRKMPSEFERVLKS